MRAKNFIAEIPMNPGAYMASLSRAQQLGIMVGFEFEVCCKPKIAKQYYKDPDHKKKSIIETSVVKDWYKNLSFADVADTFNADKTALASNNDGKKMAWFFYCWQKLGAYFNPRLGEFFSKLEGPALEEYKEQAERYEEFKGDAAYAYIILRYPHAFSAKARKSMKNLGADQLAMEVHEAWDNMPVDLIKDIFTTLDFNKARSTLGLTIPEDDYDGKISFAYKYLRDEELGQKMEDDEWESDDLWDDHNNYGYYKNPIAQAVRQGMGVNVEVFSEYHQKRKTWDRWYVEPDGSVEADESGDGIGEIVSPPIAAADAIKVLDQFYAVAKSSGFYSNESTGLHINVSLPQDTDILKLALLVGDKYVLKTFDREDSEYAMGVLSELQDGHGGLADEEYGEKIKKAKTFKNKEKYLQAMVKGIMGAHCSSMNIGPGGKYISFRGVGGSYLENHSAVKEALGRFIRAMTIASDPTEYRKEYVNKLTKLLARFAPPQEMTFGTSMDGLMALVFVQYDRTGASASEVERTMSAWQQKTQERYGACIFNNIEQFQAANVVTKFGGKEAVDFKNPGVAETARGFFAVPVTLDGQQKMLRKVGHSKLDNIGKDQTSSIDYAGSYETHPVSVTAGRTSRIRVDGIGYVPKGHPIFGRLVKSVIMGLKK